MLPQSSILTNFRIPKKLRTTEDSSNRSEVIANDKSNDSCAKQSPSQNISCKSSSPATRTESHPACEEKQSRTLCGGGNAKDREHTSKRMCNAQDINVLESNPSAVPQKESIGTDITSTVPSTTAPRRRINLSEYMSSKSINLSAARGTKETITSSNSSKRQDDKLCPLDTRKLISESVPCPNSIEMFYKDTLASLRHESQCDSDSDDLKSISVHKDAWNVIRLNDDVVMENNAGILPVFSSNDYQNKLNSIMEQKSNIGLLPSYIGANRTFGTNEALMNDGLKSHGISLRNALNPSVTGILCPPGYRRPSKKSVSWADNSGSDLEAVRFFVSDNEGLQRRYAENMGKVEVQMERNIRFGTRDDVMQDHITFFAHNILQTPLQYGPLIEVALPSYISKKVINSSEEKVQSERQKVTLQDIFLPFVSVPSTPAEPDTSSNDQDERTIESLDLIDSRGLLLKPKLIPTDDVFNDDKPPPSDAGKCEHGSSALTPTSIAITPFPTVRCTAVPSSLRPELAELLTRAHQIQYMSHTEPTSETSCSLTCNPAAAPTKLPGLINHEDLLSRLKSVLNTNETLRESISKNDLLASILSGASSGPNMPNRLDNPAEQLDVRGVHVQHISSQSSHNPIVSSVVTNELNNIGVFNSLQAVSSNVAKTTTATNFQPNLTDNLTRDSQLNIPFAPNQLRPSHPVLLNTPEANGAPTVYNSQIVESRLSSYNDSYPCMLAPGPIRSQRSGWSMPAERGMPYHPRDMMRFRIRGSAPSSNHRFRFPSRNSQSVPTGTPCPTDERVWPSFVSSNATTTSLVDRGNCSTARSSGHESNAARGSIDGFRGRRPFARFFRSSFHNGTTHIRGSFVNASRRNSFNYPGRFARGQRTRLMRKYDHSRGALHSGTRTSSKKEFSGGSGEWL